MALLTLTKAAACGQNGAVVGSPRPTTSCPSDEQIEQMESEQLNDIPRECDDNVPVPPDQDGVYVENRLDPDGDSSLDSVHSFRSAPLTVRDRLVVADDQDWTGLEWPGGVLRVQLRGVTENAFVAVMMQSGKPVPGLGDRPSSPDLELTLAAGRYFLVVARKGQGTAELSYAMSVGSQ